jgi:hypothetical protein
MTVMSEHRVGASRHLRTVFEAGALGLLADGQLLERFLAGRGDEDSAESFAALAERHGPMVLSVCRAALGDPHDAEDAAQATFLILAKRAGSIRRAESLASWLFGVALKVSSKARAKATARAAAGLAAGRAVGAVASTPVAAMVRGGMAVLFAGRLKVIAAGLLFTGTFAGLAVLGWLQAARQETRPPAAAAPRARSAPPLAARVEPIKGLVVDEGRQPVAGARVWSLDSVRRQVATTGADGMFELPLDDRHARGG